MKKKDCFKTSCLRTCAWLIALLILSPLNLFAEQEDKASRVDKIVKVKDGLVSVYATNDETMEILGNSDLVDVLKKIEAETGVKINLSKEVMGKRLDASFRDETMESAMRQLLRGHYYIISYEQDLEKKEKKVKEVTVKDNVIGKIPLKGKLITIEIPYGSEKGELGAFDKGEGFSSWPSEYAVDDDGIIYILDAVNKRIQTYSSTGVLLPSIPLKTPATYIEIDKQGLIYIFVSGSRKIYQYNKSGDILNTIAVDADRRHLKYDTAPIRIIDNHLYLDSCDYSNRCGKFLIGKITADNSLVGPTAKEFENPREKYTFQSGKIYKGKNHIPGFNSELEIIEKQGVSYRTLSTPTENILTNTLIGEDTGGNFYFETVTADKQYQLYNIDKFSPDGEYIGTAQIPGGDVAARFRIGRNGNIYSFIPEEKKAAKLFIFINEGN